MRTLHLFLIATIVSGTAPTVAAQARQVQEQVINGTGTVQIRGPVFLLPDERRTPLTTLPVGTSVDVLTREGDWYQIMFRDPTLGDRTAYMRVANIQLVPRPARRTPPVTAAPPTFTAPPPRPSAPQAPARPAASAAASRGRGESWLSRAYISLNGNYQTNTTSFGGASPFTQYAESGTRTASYAVGRAPGLDIGGGVRVWRELEVGAAVTWMSQNRDAAVSESLPHPFFFNAFRDVSGTATGLKREEMVIHGDLSWEIQAGRDAQVGVFGGPSFFRVTQGLVTGVTVNDVYPFDTATFTAATSTDTAESKIGFNVGVDFTTLFSRTVGVGVLARYSRATIDFPVNGSTLTVKTGGFQVGAGVRLRF